MDGMIAFSMYLLSFLGTTRANGYLPQMGYRIKLGEPNQVYWAYFQGRAQEMDFLQDVDDSRKTVTSDMGVDLLKTACKETPFLLAFCLLYTLI